MRGRPVGIHVPMCLSVYLTYRSFQRSFFFVLLLGLFVAEELELIEWLKQNNARDMRYSIERTTSAGKTKARERWRKERYLRCAGRRSIMRCYYCWSSSLKRVVGTMTYMELGLSAWPCLAMREDRHRCLQRWRSDLTFNEFGKFRLIVWALRAASDSRRIETRDKPLAADAVKSRNERQRKWHKRYQ